MLPGTFSCLGINGLGGRRGHEGSPGPRCTLGTLFQLPRQAEKPVSARSLAHWRPRVSEGRWPVAQGCALTQLGQAPAAG